MDRGEEKVQRKEKHEKSETLRLSRFLHWREDCRDHFDGGEFSEGCDESDLSTVGLQ